MRFRDEEKPGKVKFSTFRRVLPFFKGHMRFFYLGIIFVLLSTAIMATLPLIFREIVDVAIPSKDPDMVLEVGIFYLVLLIIHGFLQYFEAVIIGYVGIEIVNDIKLKLLRHMLYLSVRFFDKTGTGKLISRIESDSQRLFMLFSDIGLKMLAAFLNILISMVIMFFTSAKLTMFVLAIVPIYVVGTYFIFSKMRPMFRKDREFYARIAGFLGEHIKAIPLLRSLANINWSKNKFFETNREKWHYERKIFVIEQGIWFILMLAPQMAIAAILYRSVGWIEAGAITIGTVWMFIQYIHAAIHPLIMISEQLGEIQRALGAGDRIFEILDTVREVDEKENPVEGLEFKEKIKFENLSFHYEPDKPVLRDVNFTVDKGSTVAIVGATGSGKTTIMSLLCRFYDPIKGKIMIDGVDIRDLSFKDLRDKINIVLQDIYLFPGNVLDNMRVLRKDIPEEKVYEAANIIGVSNFIEKLPDGYETELSEDGGNMSFGERQLLSFSRALTFEPEILIMDEATSSVDPYTEALIQASMKKLLKGRTSIVIAHRLSTIVDADKIIVLDKGKIIEEGTHEELLAKDGNYAALYRTQQEGEHQIGGANV